MYSQRNAINAHVERHVSVYTGFKLHYCASVLRFKLEIAKEGDVRPRRHTTAQCAVDSDYPHARVCVYRIRINVDPVV